MSVERNALPELHHSAKATNMEVTITHHGRVCGMLRGMTLVRSVNRWEFDWVSDEEHGLEVFSTHATSIWGRESATYNTVEDEVLIALFSEDLHRPTPHIPNSLGCASVRPHSGDTHENFGLFANPI